MSCNSIHFEFSPPLFSLLPSHLCVYMCVCVRVCVCVRACVCVRVSAHDLCITLYTQHLTPLTFSAPLFFPPPPPTDGSWPLPLRSDEALSGQERSQPLPLQLHSTALQQEGTDALKQEHGEEVREGGRAVSTNVTFCKASEF